MYSDREALEDPLDYVHSSLSQGNKVIYYQKECYRRTLSCPASASSSVTNLDSCGKVDGSAASVPAFGSRSNSVDSGTRQSSALVTDDWEEESEVFEDVTEPSPGARMFVAALSDVVQHDEASGKFQHHGAKLYSSPPNDYERPQGTATNVSESETAWAHGNNVKPPGNKAQWFDTESAKPPKNKPQWQGGAKLESNENKPRWSDSGVSKVVSKSQWQDDIQHQNETWRSSNPIDPVKKPPWKDTDANKAKDNNELVATTSKSKKQPKDVTKSISESFSSEPVLMKLPKGKLVMTKLSVMEKLSLRYIEEGHVKVLSNVREPDDQHCYLFIPDVKSYPEVLEDLIENWCPTAGTHSAQSGLEPTHLVAEKTPTRLMYSRKELMAIKLLGNTSSCTVIHLPESLDHLKKK